VPAVELVVLDFVAQVLQLGDNAPAAGLDRQYLVTAAMRNKYARFATLHGRRDEAGREGDDVGEDIAVGNAE